MIGILIKGTGFIINLCKDETNNTCVPVLITNNHVVENSVETVFEFCKADNLGNPIDTESVTLVRMLRLTEKQYDNITMITGEPDYQEQTVGTNCHIMI